MELWKVKLEMKDNVKHSALFAALISGHQGFIDWLKSEEISHFELPLGADEDPEVRFLIEGEYWTAKFKSSNKTFSNLVWS